MRDYEGIRCGKCGDGVANVHEGEEVKSCPFCAVTFHGDCLEGHYCEAMHEAGTEKLAAWSAAAERWTG